MKIDVFDPLTGELIQQVDLPLDDDGVPPGAVLDDRGHEVVDPTPVAPPIGFVASEPLEVQIRNMVQGELLKRAASEAGFGTFSDEDDFDVGDDFDPASPYEEIFEGVTRLDVVQNRTALEAEFARRDGLGKARDGKPPAAASAAGDVPKPPAEPAKASSTVVAAADGGGSQGAAS